MKNILKVIGTTALCGLATSALYAEGVTIENPSFEDRWAGWEDTDPSAISGEPYDGSRSAKLEGAGAKMEQVVLVEEDTNYTLTAWIKGKGQVGVVINGTTKLADYVPVDADAEPSPWKQVAVSFNSGSSESVVIFGAYSEATGRFDHFSMVSN
ncbi:carbohydrate binding domain-containing protein [Marinomonas sp. C2222]|uniref:Carbohydrate binding domain-containing protein n=1 Tax=Marinomonas sargassi TaxID=2984494 RepID=A0ABT2YQ20_9GAMM|nr:carbohydrate binding domain-containing protein [Marinomonas sargassi]MCV2401983.1 carbohydrate binding domain-containing protein [Marinomonas sargassi]